MTTIPPEPWDGTEMERVYGSVGRRIWRDDEDAKDWPTATPDEHWFRLPGDRDREPVSWPSALAWLLEDVADRDAVRAERGRTNAQATTTSPPLPAACCGLTEAQADHFVRAPCGRRDPHGEHADCPPNAQATTTDPGRTALLELIEAYATARTNEFGAGEFAGSDDVKRYAAEADQLMARIVASLSAAPSREQKETPDAY